MRRCWRSVSRREPLFSPCLWSLARSTTTTTETTATETTTTATTPTTTATTAPTRAAESTAVPMPYRSAHKGRGDSARLQRERPSASAANHLGPHSSCAEDGGAVPGRPLSALQRRQLLFRHKAAFSLTPQALRRVQYLIGQYKAPQAPQAPQGAKGRAEELPDGIRIGVRRRGCSGYSYTVNYHFPPASAVSEVSEREVKEMGKEKEGKDSLAGLVLNGSRDVIVEQGGIKVVVDADALFYVIGTEMDYVVRNVEEKFTFRNPNQKLSCGCEESFMPFDVDEQE